MRPAAMLLLAGLAIGCGGAPPGPPATSAPRQTIRIAGTRLAIALTDALARARPDLDVQHVDGSPIGSQDLVRTGEADLGIALADSVYFSHLGESEANAPRGLRAMTALHVAPILAFVRPGAGIRTLADVRGHRARIAPLPREDDLRFSGWPVPRRLTGRGDGTVTGVTSLPQLVLLAFGVTPADVVNVPITQTEAIAEMKEGRLDAVFGMGFEAAAYPAQALAAGARFLSVEGDAVERLRREYSFIRPMALPPGTYPGQTEAVRTVGVNMVLVCRADLDEALVYDLTRIFFDVLPDLAELGEVRGIDPQQAPLAPIPLHEGSARYFREAELFP